MMKRSMRSGIRFPAAKKARFSLVAGVALILLLTSILFVYAACSKKPAAPLAPPAELAKATRVDTNGWINVHLEGTPREIGFQHGWLLAPEIDDLMRALSHFLEGSTKRDWAFFRAAAERMFWPKLETEYQEEIEDIAAGLRARLPRAKYDRIAITDL